MAPSADILLGTAFIGLKFGVLYWMCRRHQPRERVGVVEKIFIYPIKSCPGIAVDWCSLTFKGVARDGLVDRGFLIVRSDLSFVTQRTNPELANVRLEASETALVVRAPGMDELRLPFEPRPGAAEVTVRVWTTTTKGLDCGDEAARWVERFLQMPGARVVQAHPDLTSRPSVPMSHLRGHDVRPQDVTHFQDNAPFHLLSTASIADINSRVDPPTDERNYRPNILVADAACAYDEDHWTDIFIGAARLHGMWLNERCKFTTVDPSRGAFRPDHQPLQDLSKSRSLDGHKTPCLGTNVGLDMAGVIRVGDEVFAVRGQVA